MIYLDHAAATPMSKKVREAMQPYFSEQFFNPSAAYLPAKRVAEAYAEAKGEIAHAIGAKGNDLVMTGSATEANNLAFTCLSESGEVLAAVTEHDSVLKIVESVGGNTIDVNRSGMINLDDLKAKITDRTELVSIALANNELGTIQPLSEVARILTEARQERLARGSKRPLYLHSDASQALNLLDVSVARLGVDMLTLNAAKIYGPKGVGALYATHDVRLRPLTLGGGQERNLRSGTENVAGVIGFAKAMTEAKKHVATNRKKFADLRQILLENLENFQLLNKKHSLDNFVVLCYDGLDAERLLFKLEEHEVYVATGAACAASKGERSHVLAAIGLSESEIAGSLRLTLGALNDEKQMHTAAQIINQAVREERERIERRG